MMGDVAKVAGMRAQLEFLKKLKRLMELEAPQTTDGVPVRPFSLWINRLMVDIVTAESWLAKIDR